MHPECFSFTCTQHLCAWVHGDTWSPAQVTHLMPIEGQKHCRGPSQVCSQQVCCQQMHGQLLQDHGYCWPDKQLARAGGAHGNLVRESLTQYPDYQWEWGSWCQRSLWNGRPLSKLKGKKRGATLGAMGDWHTWGDSLCSLGSSWEKAAQKSREAYLA